MRAVSQIPALLHSMRVRDLKAGVQSRTPASPVELVISDDLLHTCISQNILPTNARTFPRVFHGNARKYLHSMARQMTGGIEGVILGDRAREIPFFISVDSSAAAVRF